MNKKIFTLLACAVVLFSTAFNANARSVAQRSVGDYVRSISLGMSPGMYHIQVDSVCLLDPAGTTNAAGILQDLKWYPVTVPRSNPGPYAQLMPNGRFELINAASTNGDTVILAATETGIVKMISAGHLQQTLADDTKGLNFLDLQAAMWCVNVVETAVVGVGQPHTFHFTNKAHQLELDWAITGKPELVSGEGRGWMFSDVLTNLRHSWPFYHLHDGNDDSGSGRYRVVVSDTTGFQRHVSGYSPNKSYKGDTLMTTRVAIDQFNSGKVIGMLKFSLVQVSPIVLNAEDFNTKLGLYKDEQRVKINFDRNMEDNVLKDWLFAQQANTSGVHHGDYLNLRIYGENDDTENSFKGYAVNDNRNNTDKYSNKAGVGYMKIERRNVNVPGGNDVTGDYNFSYRFVYFPSEDSIVMNAYNIDHHNHLVEGPNAYTDNVDPYWTDAPGNYFYYGLYTPNIQDQLIVRYQDLNKLVDGASNMITIGKHPANVRMSLGRNCDEELEAWQVPKGVYTIWDDLGRCLGVRIYNGSYSPQWIELMDGECPDRIPSYQWVVDYDNHVTPRITLYNREFGNMDNISTALGKVVIEKVLVTRGKSKIFNHLELFHYGPLIDGGSGHKYEPINDAYVEGRIVQPIGTMDCGIKSAISGFRPVTKEYVADKYLGYKHFRIDTDQTINGTKNPSYGKSEDVADDYGMDYHAYAFKYLHNYNEEGGIALEPRYTDQLLRWEEQPIGFRFLPGRYIQPRNFAEERYGYPKSNWTNVKIKDDLFNIEYVQPLVPVLERYYYELKVADYYSYRNELAEQFVVLKGAGKQLGTSDGDWHNELYYGVADVYARTDPFKYANVYLRETYFLPRVKEKGEFRHKEDDSRRIYYVLLDRIEEEQFERVTQMGLEVSDTLMTHEASALYNLVSIVVEDYPGFLRAQGKTVSSARVSAFSLSNLNYELYRRLRSLNDDITLGEDEEKPTGLDLDAPKVLRIHRDNNPMEYLYEDGISTTASGKGINFLGLSNATMNPEEVAPDGTVKFNYHLLIDTAFINRGTGPIKPQYLIAVNPTSFDGETYKDVIDMPCGPEPILKEIMPFIHARYLVNATDSSRKIGSEGANNAPLRDPRYLLEPDYDRLVFVDAVHANDRLYILSELRKYMKDSEIFFEASDGKKYFDAKVVDAAIKSKNIPERRPQNSQMYGAFYDFGVWDDYHNDVTFSLRFTTPEAKNADETGKDFVSNFTKRFYIESETKHRNVFGNPKIAPVQGGWIRIHNSFIPVLSRNAYGDPIQDAEIFNVMKPTSWQNGEPTSNDNIAEFSVVGGVDEVIILNAANKTVKITNLLGQTIANVALTGNNQKISAPKGIVVVKVEGEEAIKAVVK